MFKPMKPTNKYINNKNNNNGHNNKKSKNYTRNTFIIIFARKSNQINLYLNK